MQKMYKYLPHTADVAFEAFGSTYRQALENAASAMINLMVDAKELASSKATLKKLRITANAHDYKELVWFTLQYIVSKADEKTLQPVNFKIKSITKKRAKFYLEGNLFYKKDKKYYSLFDVKAVTPHTLSVENKKKRWKIHVLLDV